MLAKAAGLTAQAKAVVDQVSVADGGMSHDVLVATMPLSEDTLLDATALAVDSGLLVAVGDGYAFRHALIQQAIFSELLPGERRRLHRRLAEALAARDDSIRPGWRSTGTRPAAPGPGQPLRWRPRG